MKKPAKNSIFKQKPQIESQNIARDRAPATRIVELQLIFGKTQKKDMSVQKTGQFRIKRVLCNGLH